MVFLIYFFNGALEFLVRSLTLKAPWPFCDGVIEGSHREAGTLYRMLCILVPVAHRLDEKDALSTS